jgi:hypothetical protein
MAEELLSVFGNVENKNGLYEKLSTVENTPDVQTLWGINNFIAKVEANSMDLLTNIIKTDLKLAMEVSHLLTLIMEPGKQ